MEVYHYLAGTPAWALTWSPDSRTWVIGNESGQAYEFDTTGKGVAHLEDPLGNIDTLGWSPDGKLLVGGDGVCLWQGDGKRVAALSDGNNRVTSVAWSPDGAMFAAATDSKFASGTTLTDHAVRIWNPDGRLLALLTDHTDGVLKVAWAPNGRILASGSRDHTVRLWVLPQSLR